MSIVTWMHSVGSRTTVRQFSKSFGWVDGQQVLDGAVSLSSALPASAQIEAGKALGTFNEPADVRGDWVDVTVIATGCIGLEPGAGDALFVNGFEAVALSAQ